MRWLISLLLVVCTSFGMAFPFTPHTTFTDDATPAIDAGFLNDLQGGVNAVAAPVYQEQAKCKAIAIDLATVQVVVTSTLIKDAATSQYIACPYAGTTLTPTHLTPTPAVTWPLSRWLYGYLVCTNGVASFEVSETAPDTIIGRAPLYKTGDETRRYLVSFYSDGSGNLYRFGSINGRYTYTDRVPVVNVVTGSTSLVPTSIATAVPPHALNVALQGWGDSTYTSSNTVYVTPDGFGSNYSILLVWTAYSGSGDRPWASGYLSMPLLNGNSFQWKTASAGVASLLINVIEWSE